MALTMDGLRKLVDAEGLRYFLDPSRDALMMAASGMNGRYQFVVILEKKGEFLQFRTIGYLNCPEDHPHHMEVLKVLGKINYRIRLVKYGWDPKDGEITAYADAWLMDNKLTQQQLKRMLQNFLPTIDMSYSRIKRTMETGEDPGEENPAKMVERIREEGGALPPKLKKLIDELMGKAKKASEEDDPEIRDI